MTSSSCLIIECYMTSENNSAISNSNTVYITSRWKEIIRMDLMEI